MGGVRSGTVLVITSLLASLLLTGCTDVSQREIPVTGLPEDPLVTAALSLEATASEVPGFEANPLAEASLQPTDLFDVDAAMTHVRHLADVIGERPAGGPGERAAADYVAQQLRSWGYEPRIEEFALPNGVTSVNVVAERIGTAPQRFVLGAHLDTKSPSPGANDNATGVAVVLEIARELATLDPVATIEFAFFGAEERIDDDPDHHHYGSRTRVAAMSADELDTIAGMISVDMIGYGPALHVRTMRRGPQTLSDALLSYAATREIDATFRIDPGPTGWSDHEAYELAGVPAAWVEWRDDPVYHTAGDTASHVQSSRVDTAGELVWGYVLGLDVEEIGSLLGR